MSTNVSTHTEVNGPSSTAYVIAEIKAAITYNNFVRFATLAAASVRQDDASAETVEELSRTFFTESIAAGRMHFVTFLIGIGLVLPDTALDKAVEARAHIMIRFLLSCGLVPNAGTFIKAVSIGDVQGLELLASAANPEWDATVTAAAAEYTDHSTSFMMTKFLHAKGCPWDKTACEAAITEDNDWSLRYVLENMSPNAYDIGRLVDLSDTLGSARCSNVIRNYAYPRRGTVAQPTELFPMMQV